MTRYKQYIPNWYQTSSPPYEFEFSTQEEMEADVSVNWIKDLDDFIGYAYREWNPGKFQLVGLRSGEDTETHSTWIVMGDLIGQLPSWLERYEPEIDRIIKRYRDETL